MKTTNNKAITLRTLTLLSAASLLLLTSSTNLAQSISQANQVWSEKSSDQREGPLLPVRWWYPNEDGSSTIAWLFQHE